MRAQGRWAAVAGSGGGGDCQCPGLLELTLVVSDRLQEGERRRVDDSERDSASPAGRHRRHPRAASQSESLVKTPKHTSKPQPLTTPPSVPNQLQAKNAATFQQITTDSATVARTEAQISEMIADFDKVRFRRADSPTCDLRH